MMSVAFGVAIIVVTLIVLWAGEDDETPRS